MTGHIEGTCGRNAPDEDEKERELISEVNGPPQEAPGYPIVWGSSSTTGDHGPDMDQAPYCLAVRAVSRSSEPDGKGQAEGQA